ncbi:IS1096 element passenger TnpR family protein [Muricauda sp. CP2A]|jgi:hypothetical protein
MSFRFRGQKLEYPYDFGDYWQHSLTLEVIKDELAIPFPFVVPEN